MGSITNLYPQTLVLSKPPEQGFEPYTKILIAPKTSIAWDGRDCFLSCDNPEHPEYYQDLPASTKENTYLPGQWLWHGVSFLIHSGVELRRDLQRSEIFHG